MIMSESADLRRIPAALTSPFAPIILALVLSAKTVMIGLLLGGDFAGQLLLAARYTARASFMIFLVVYCASSLVRLWPNDATRLIMRHRRQWGLGFALAHTIHLAALAMYNIIILNRPGLQSLLGGGLAYALMFVMALTSNRASMKAMGIWWKRVHSAGIHWLWFIFTFSYFGRLFDPGRMMQGAILFPLCVAALGLRLWVWARRRQQFARPTSTLPRDEDGYAR
jgi:methionine sulfoxide reductase heme-binding subunit